jgi:hypothetical protein
MSSRLVLPWLHVHVDYGAFRCYAFGRVILVSKDIIYVIIIHYL